MKINYTLVVTSGLALIAYLFDNFEKLSRLKIILGGAALFVLVLLAGLFMYECLNSGGANDE